MSLDAGQQKGTVLTKPLIMEGKNLHLNVDAPQGEVRAEILDAEGKQVLSGFSRGECIPVRGDSLNGGTEVEEIEFGCTSGQDRPPAVCAPRCTTVRVLGRKLTDSSKVRSFNGHKPLPHPEAFRPSMSEDLISP